MQQYIFDSDLPEDSCLKDYLDLFSGAKSGHLTKYVYSNTQKDWFSELTKNANYYLCKAERDLISQISVDLKSKGIESLYEIGPGGQESCLNKTIPFSRLLGVKRYVAIDINEEYANSTAQFIHEQMNIETSSLIADAWQSLDLQDHKQKAIGLLGGTIGNLDDSELDILFYNLRSNMTSKDIFFVTADSNKEEYTLNNAYNNLCVRGLASNIMKHFKAEYSVDNFDPESFEMLYEWDVSDNTVKVSLVSTCDQQFCVADHNIHIKKGGKFHVISSRKYSSKDILNMVKPRGFEIEGIFGAPNNSLQMYMLRLSH